MFCYILPSPIVCRAGMLNLELLSIFNHMQIWLESAAAMSEDLKFFLYRHVASADLSEGLVVSRQC